LQVFYSFCFIFDFKLFYHHYLDPFRSRRVVFGVCHRLESFSRSAPRPERRELVAKDVCEALGVVSHRDAVTKLDDDEKGGVGLADAMGRVQDPSSACSRAKKDGSRAEPSNQRPTLAGAGLMAPAGRPSLQHRWHAAEVASAVPNIGHDISDHYLHLSAIHPAPERLWRTSVFNGPLKAATSDDASFPRYEFHSQRFAILAKHIV
jgi:hypothetical protein